MEVYVLGLVIILLVVYVVWRDIRNDKKTARLEELLKARSLSEYKQAAEPEKAEDNPIGEAEPNELPLDETAPWDLPDEFNIENDSGKTQTVRIFKDGQPVKE